MDAVNSSAIIDAHEKTHKSAVLPHYKLDKADVIGSTGSFVVGGVNYVFGVSGISAAAVAVAGAVYGLTWLSRRSAHLPPKPAKPKKERKSSAVTQAANLLWLWVVSAKHRVCLLIDADKETADAS